MASSFAAWLARWAVADSNPPRAEVGSRDLGHPARGPHIPAKAIRFGSFGLQRWKLRLDDPVLDAKPGVQLEKLLVRARRALPRKL
jgi:hypothetical protein